MPPRRATVGPHASIVAAAVRVVLTSIGCLGVLHDGGGHVHPPTAVTGSAVVVPDALGLALPRL